MTGKRWFIGYQKAYNTKGAVAHLMFPGFVVNEAALLQWDDQKLANHLLAPLAEAAVVVTQLKEDARVVIRNRGPKVPPPPAAVPVPPFRRE